MTSGPILVDVHMHLYESKAVGEWWKGGYEIFEYGSKPDVRFGPYSGDVEDAVAALDGAGYQHGVAVNLFSMDLFREEAASALPEGLTPAERAEAVRRIEDGLPERMRDYNRWLVDALASIPRITPYVAVDPSALSPSENVEHLRAMADRGAKGIKLHPVVQRFEPGDPRMRPVFEACREMGLVVLSHTGASKGGETFAEPGAFASVLRELPGLKVVLAHLGGGRWRQTEALAAAFPDVAFDICEIIEWTGAPNAPTREELAHLVAAVGPERVMLGTDFPWYELDRTAQLVLDLPALAASDKERILGENAVRILALPV
jgi:predicted TIM-barrel fold metal-dependent hydrolase